jgi:CDP-alcohol phosphatidyltransferase
MSVTSSVDDRVWASARSCGPLDSLMCAVETTGASRVGFLPDSKEHANRHGQSQPDEHEGKAPGALWSCSRSPVRASPNEPGLDLSEERFRETFELRSGELDPVAEVELHDRLVGHEFDQVVVAQDPIVVDQPVSQQLDGVTVRWGNREHRGRPSGAAPSGYSSALGGQPLEDVFENSFQPLDLRPRVGVLALATDVADGRLARCLAAETMFGGYADALADARFWTWFAVRYEPNRWLRAAAILAWAMPVAAVAA